MSTETGRQGKDDDRLPLRWGVILLGAAGAGIGAAWLGGALVGIGFGVTMTGLLFKILSG